MYATITVKVEGLEPITEAINSLAAAIGSASNVNATAATAVIEKAKGSKAKPNAAASADGNQTTSQPVEVSAPSSTTENPAVTSSTASSAVTDPKSAASVESAGNASTTTETAAPLTESSDAQAPKTISDEELRSLAGKAATRNKEKTKELINKYATAVSLVPADKRPALVKELEAVA